MLTGVGWAFGTRQVLYTTKIITGGVRYLLGAREEIPWLGFKLSVTNSFVGNIWLGVPPIDT